jgi:hypothetical protein
MRTVKASVRKPVTGKRQNSPNQLIPVLRFLKLGIQYVPTNETVNRSTYQYTYF